jgi:hypothetical protein
MIMPPRKACPHCGTFVEDWFREWYPGDEQPKIFRGLLAADCPNPDCLRGVKLTLTVEPAPADAPVLARSHAAASRWVFHEKRGLYADLESFLRSGDPAALAYRDYEFRP